MNDAANSIARNSNSADQSGFIAEWLLQLALVGAALAALAHAVASLNGGL